MDAYVTNIKISPEDQNLFSGGRTLFHQAKEEAASKGPGRGRTLFHQAKEEGASLGPGWGRTLFHQAKEEAASLGLGWGRARGAEGFFALMLKTWPARRVTHLVHWTCSQKQTGGVLTGRKPGDWVGRGRWQELFGLGWMNRRKRADSNFLLLTNSFRKNNFKILTLVWSQLWTGLFTYAEFTSAISSAISH